MRFGVQCTRYLAPGPLGVDRRGARAVRSRVDLVTAAVRSEPMRGGAAAEEPRRAVLHFLAEEGLQLIAGREQCTLIPSVYERRLDDARGLRGRITELGACALDAGAVLGVERAF